MVSVMEWIGFDYDSLIEFLIFFKKLCGACVDKRFSVWYYGIMTCRRLDGEGQLDLREEPNV